MTEAYGRCASLHDALRSPAMTNKRKGRPPGPTGTAKDLIGIRLDPGDIAALEQIAQERNVKTPGASATKASLARAFIVAGIEAWRREKASGKRQG